MIVKRDSRRADGGQEGWGGDRLLASDSGASFLNRCRRSELINEVLLLLPAATASSPERTHAAFVAAAAAAAGLGHPLFPPSLATSLCAY